MANVTRTTLVVGTGAGILTVDQFTPTVDWILNGCPLGARPDSTAVLLATGAVMVLTAAYHGVQAYLQAIYQPEEGDTPPNPPHAGP